jgi:uncharacterized protein YerC
MVRINRHKLAPEKLEELFRQFSALLSSSSNKNVHLLLKQLLGPEERVMLAKRLAVIVMLDQKHSYNRIADVLHISPSTAANVSNRLNKKQVEKVVSVLKKDKVNYEAIIEVIESILTVGGIMPSRAGLDRYRGIR